MGVRFPKTVELPAALLTLACLSLLVNATLGQRIEAARIGTDIEEELALYPSGRFLRQAVAGFRHVTADLLWLKAIQYYGKHKQTDMVFDKAAHVFDVLTDLDPQFLEAYRFGALVVVEDAKEPGRGYDLLRKGIRENPENWELHFDLGFHYYLNEDYDLAAAAFRQAARLPGDRKRAARFAAMAEKKTGRLDAARALWEEMLATTENDRYREAARFALSAITVAEDTTRIAKFARVFRDRRGRFPRSMEELAAEGFVTEAPVDPFGVPYLIRPATGEVRSAHLLAMRVRHDKQILQGAADRFRSLHGRSPRDLEEVVAAGLLDRVPDDFGARYSIDPRDGAVRVRFDFLRMSDPSDDRTG
ncbi:MAG: hypothetical protein JW958_08405 [Candidatus Eisenbacteria bacterium]|nr:hypothetical protein [Candidatus Eisenbacteria bacterium]